MTIMTSRLMLSIISKISFFDDLLTMNDFYFAGCKIETNLRNYQTIAQQNNFFALAQSLKSVEKVANNKKKWRKTDRNLHSNFCYQIWKVAIRACTCTVRELRNTKYICLFSPSPSFFFIPHFFSIISDTNDKSECDHPIALFS